MDIKNMLNTLKIAMESSYSRLYGTDFPIVIESIKHATGDDYLIELKNVDTLRSVFKSVFYPLFRQGMKYSFTTTNDLILVNVRYGVDYAGKRYVIAWSEEHRFLEFRSSDLSQSGGYKNVLVISILSLFSPDGEGNLKSYFSILPENESVYFTPDDERIYPVNSTGNFFRGSPEVRRRPNYRVSKLKGASELLLSILFGLDELPDLKKYAMYKKKSSVKSLDLFYLLPHRFSLSEENSLYLMTGMKVSIIAGK